MVCEHETMNKNTYRDLKIHLISYLDRDLGRRRPCDKEEHKQGDSKAHHKPPEYLKTDTHPRRRIPKREQPGSSFEIIFTILFLSFFNATDGVDSKAASAVPMAVEIVGNLLLMEKGVVGAPRGGVAREG